MNPAIEQTDRSLFARLRVETRFEHDQVEQGMPVFAKNFRSEDYYRLLNSFREFYRPYEEKLRPLVRSLPAGLECDSRYKLGLLNADLIGHDQIESPKLFEIPSMSNIPEIVGAMYVIEGSTLGGQVIYRHLKDTLKLDLDRSNFFRCYNESTGLMWSRFKTEAVKLVSPDEYEIAIAAAKQTFECFGACLASRLR